MSKPWRPKKINFKSGSTESCRIWNLEFKTEGETRFVRLIDGLINNISAQNINEWVEIQEDGFLILRILSSAGSLSEFSLMFSTEPPDPIGDTESLPPTQFDLFFAKVRGFSAISKFTKALSVLPYLSRSIGATPSSPAENNFINYYTWKINEV